MAYGCEPPDEITNDHSLLSLDYYPYCNRVANIPELHSCRSRTVLAIIYASVHLRMHFIAGVSSIT